MMRVWMERLMCEPPGGWAGGRAAKGCPGLVPRDLPAYHGSVAVIPGGVWRHLVEFFVRSAVLLRCRIGVGGVARWVLTRSALFCVVVCGVPLRCPVDVLGSPPCPIDDSSGGLLSIGVSG